MTLGTRLLFVCCALLCFVDYFPFLLMLRVCFFSPILERLFFWCSFLQNFLSSLFCRVGESMARKMKIKQKKNMVQRLPGLLLICKVTAAACCFYDGNCFLFRFAKLFV